MENQIITFLSGKVRKGTVLSEKEKFAFQLISIAQLLRRISGTQGQFSEKYLFGRRFEI